MGLAPTKGDHKGPRPAPHLSRPYYDTSPYNDTGLGPPPRATTRYGSRAPLRATTRVPTLLYTSPAPTMIRVGGVDCQSPGDIKTYDISASQTRGTQPPNNTGNDWRICVKGQASYASQLIRNVLYKVAVKPPPFSWQGERQVRQASPLRGL